ncbi:hypothetical protein OPQ81_000753 [Rhizoctonia solani]|nr:hypothetical protein OPQ81_000753 [Rhizoctonia solani]
MSSEYTITVQGETFLLLEAQLLFDSPNLFTHHFTSEPSQRQMRFSRNPQLFSLIHEYLCGYTILPIHESALPKRMSRETALKNLRADAVYYGLEKLVNLIDASNQALVPPNPQGSSEKQKEVTKTSQKLPSFFHFPGRVSSFSTSWYNSPSAFVEFPLPISLTKSFTIAMSNKGWHTLLSFDVPLVTRPLLYISISPEQDFRFEIGIATRKCPYIRALYSNGKEIVSSDANIHIYNPTPAQTRMALMRGSWDQLRTAGFIGQVEDVSLFQRVLGQDEIISRASRVNAPADHGWPGPEGWDPLNDSVY